MILRANCPSVLREFFPSNAATPVFILFTLHQDAYIHNSQLHTSKYFNVKKKKYLFVLKFNLQTTSQSNTQSADNNRVISETTWQIFICRIFFWFTHINLWFRVRCNYNIDDY